MIDTTKLKKFIKENWVVILAFVLFGGLLVSMLAMGGNRTSGGCREKFGVPGNFPAAIGVSLKDSKDGPPMPTSASDPTLALRSLDTNLGEQPTVKPEDWSVLAPPDDKLRNQHLLDPTKFVGIDTVAGSLRNANYDIRSAPINPRVPTGPWNSSTIEADPYRRPLE